MGSVMTGLEIVSNVQGQDNTGYPAAITQQHRSMTMAGAGTTVSTAQVDSISTTTLATITGLSQQVVPGNYKFRCILPGTASASGGVKAAFLFTSCSITSLQAASKVFAAAAVAVSATVTATTSGSALVASTSAGILTEIEGVLTVGSITGQYGTIALQFAQNVSVAASSSVYVGASMNFVKY